MFQEISDIFSYMLTSGSLSFAEIISKNSGFQNIMSDYGIWGVAGAVIAAVITAGILISKSRTKHKATRAANYIEKNLNLEDQKDIYVRTETTRRKKSTDNKD